MEGNVSVSSSEVWSVDETFHMMTISIQHYYLWISAGQAAKCTLGASFKLVALKRHVENTWKAQKM